jgi:hypothetical protein
LHSISKVQKFQIYSHGMLYLNSKINKYILSLDSICQSIHPSDNYLGNNLQMCHNMTLILFYCKYHTNAYHQYSLFHRLTDSI